MNVPETLETALWPFFLLVYVQVPNAKNIRAAVIFSALWGCKPEPQKIPSLRFPPLRGIAPTLVSPAAI